ncbi:DUF6913 domain-containing protein [Flavobacterium seoulense]|uniref:Uncharacterized protein n=1 Tax=Flavobacterium seoulense TaxID=1492738 RepID=A0A066WV06_9FLAO|nr:hypothetical protein [Flavobacterium seoulense]KDN56408.1 hypothetical protein FEM21_04270 [Flavobacterium seoulense]
MFLNYLKGFWVKKMLKNSLLNVKSGSLDGIVKTIGIVVDESHFAATQLLINEFIANGIAKEDIELLIYKSKSSLDSGLKVIKLESGHLNWKAQITNEEVNNFIAKDFNLLVNYYDIEKAILLTVTNESKAKFKVGFSTINKRLNNLIITTGLENHAVFVEELFKYLKILNKI